MAQLPAAANCVITKIGGTIGSGRWATIHYLQYTGTAPQVSDLQTVLSAIVSAWTTNIAPLCSPNVILNSNYAADLTSATASFITQTVTAVPGTRTGVTNPNNTAMVASWAINHRYRGGHPRTYFPAGVQADITNGSQWTTAFKTLALSSCQAYHTALNAITHGSTTYKHICLSYHVNKALRPQPVPFTINAVSIHGRADTQRLRLGKETP